MNKIESEISKLEKMRAVFESNKLKIIELEAELQSKQQSLKTDAINNLLSGNLEVDNKSNPIAKLEIAIENLEKHNQNLSEAISLQSKSILPRLEIEERAKKLQSMNKELLEMVSDYDVQKLNESIQSLKKIYDFIQSISNECNLNSFVLGNGEPTGEIRFLKNYEYLTTVSADNFFDFVNRHIQTSNICLSELDLNVQNYLNNGRSFPNY